MDCSNNELINLDLYYAIEHLNCSDNELMSFDASNYPSLTSFYCHNNLLASLDVRSGNNTSLSSFISTNNPNLTCINVDDALWSTTNWTNIDQQHYFSNNCSSTSIKEHTTNKELLKVTDLLGRETKQTNQPLFYIYDDGTVEKRIVIE